MRNLDDDTRTVVYLAIDFKTDVRRFRLVQQDSEAVASTLNLSSNLAFAPNVVVLRDPSRRLAIHFSPLRIFYQSLGAGIWRNPLGNLLGSIKALSENNGSAEIARIGFHTVNYANLGLNHSELVASVFSSYTADRETLQARFGALDDVMLSLYGKRSGRTFRLQIAPQNEQDIKKSFFADANLELYLSEKFLDNGVKEFYDRLGKDVLNIDVDISQDNVRGDVIHTFVQAAIGDAKSLTGSANKMLLEITDE